MQFSLNTIIDLLYKKYSSAYVQWEKEYGEPGYDTPSNGILLGNWNHVPSFIQKYLERNNYALEWSDEWITSDIGKIYRTNATHHGWKQSFVVIGGDVIGKDEVVPNSSALNQYVEYLTNDPKTCDVFDLDWTLLGYTKCNKEEYETGFHTGMNDSPTKVFEAVQKEYPDCDFIFVLDETSQSYVTWSVWRKEKEEE